MEKEMIQRLERCLPHGSGIDNTWHIEPPSKRGKYYRCYNSYHTMDEYGHYDGWADFVVLIDKDDPTEFKLQFRGRYARRLAEEHNLREYLEDLFYYALIDEFPKIVGQLNHHYKLISDSQEIRNLGINPWDHPIVFINLVTNRVYGVKNNLDFLYLPIKRIK